MSHPFVSGIKLLLMRKIRRRVMCSPNAVKVPTLYGLCYTPKFPTRIYVSMFPGKIVTSAKTEFSGHFLLILSRISWPGHMSRCTLLINTAYKSSHLSLAISKNFTLKLCIYFTKEEDLDNFYNVL